MLDDTTGTPTFAGYLMFSGVFPNAKIQQIAVIDGHRRRGVGSALLRETISRREAEGCLRITAAVADNLPGPQAFYEKNGFGAVLERPGAGPGSALSPSGRGIWTTSICYRRSIGRARGIRSRLGSVYVRAERGSRPCMRST